MSLPKKIAFSILTTGLVLLLINGGFALVERVRFGGNVAEKESIYQSTPEGRRTLRPGARLEGSSTKVVINSLGFRGPELAQPKPGNGFRIWCIGGSTTFDVWAPNDQATWPAKLQSYLQEARSDRVIEVVNAGIPGELLNGSRDDFEQHFDKVKPDAMVFYHGPNDLRRLAFEGPPPVAKGLEEKFAIVRSVRGAVQRKLPRIPAEWHGKRLSSHAFGDLQQTILDLLHSARSRNVKVLMVSHALQADPLSTGDDALRGVSEVAALMQMAPPDVLHTYRDYNNMLRATAEAQGLPYADLRKRMPSGDRYWGDSLHFSATGSDIAGRFLSEAFLKTGWL